jgi:hypothetical protein
VAPELAVELVVAGDEPGLEHGVLALHLDLRLGDRVLRGARAVTDLQAEVPEGIEHAVIEKLPLRREVLRPRPGGVKEHEVDIAEGAELGPPIAAQREEGERGAEPPVFRLPLPLDPGDEGRNENIE